MITNNMVYLEGNLVEKPKSQKTKSGKKMAVFSLAVDSNNKTDYFPIVVFDEQAKASLKNLDRGDKIGLFGKLQFSKFEKNQLTINSVEVVANKILYLFVKSKKEKNTKKEIINEFEW